MLRAADQQSNPPVKQSNCPIFNTNGASGSQAQDILACARFGHCSGRRPTWKGGPKKGARKTSRVPSTTGVLWPTERSQCVWQQLVAGILWNWSGPLLTPFFGAFRLPLCHRSTSAVRSIFLFQFPSCHSACLSVCVVVVVMLYQRVTGSWKKNAMCLLNGRADAVAAHPGWVSLSTRRYLTCCGVA